MLTSAAIRQQFIDYFVKKHGHTFVPSSPVVPHGDPTLLFTNAGMNQFKDVFLATGTRDYTRAVNSQKCIRAGGKHNDLEDVGKDTYHHTFFEMLGNWSFGDYFKAEAIAWAWDLLTNVWGIDKSRLHATVFGGDEGDGLEPDHEAAELWRTVTDIDPTHIHFGSKKDNFWEMGDTGPCGPCSEIHIDRTADKSGASLINADDARVMEIWNLVFMQFNRDTSGKLSPLPARHVDTGMGFERICAVLQNVDSNYDTDVFAPVFKAIAEVTRAKPYGRRLDDATDMAYRVIADHIRCLTFALTDGAVPSNEGRGYVLRRILRRAVRHGWQTMNMHEPFLHKLVPAVVDAMGDAFPELRQNPEEVAETIREEEASFARTIDRGIAHFNQAELFALARAYEEKIGVNVTATIDATSGKETLVRLLTYTDAKGESHTLSIDDPAKFAQKEQLRIEISGEDAFKLHDTFGFPLDLTQVMAEERGMTVDTAGFDRLMEQARELARGGAGKVTPAAALADVVQKHTLPATTFHGYDHTELDTTSRRWLFRFDGTQFIETNEATPGDRVALVVENSPFYAEAGGQVADVGTIETSDGARIAIDDTQRLGEVIFHLGEVQERAFTASPDKAEPLKLRVDASRRSRIMANHTATHVLNHKLRAVLGDHVQQKGSLVDDQKLRFDFSHNPAVTSEQMQRIEELANHDIAADLPVYYDYAPLDEAQRIRSLRAVFGEKYPPRVRIVSIGVPPRDLLANPDNAEWDNYSIEFCGGTHLAKTGDAEGLVITQEEAVAKGVRRIVALTGAAAHQAQATASMLQGRIDALRNAPAEELVKALPEVTNAVNEAQLPAVARGSLRDKLAELQKVVKQYEKERSKASTGNVVEEARQIAESSTGPLIVAALDNADADALRTAMDVIRKKNPESALLLGGATDGKVAFVAAVPKDLIGKGLKAGDWVREVAKVAGGGGGGRPDMAQAGGKDPDKLSEALEVGRAFALERMK